MRQYRCPRFFWFAAIALLAAMASMTGTGDSIASHRSSFIVQGGDQEAAAAAVENVGGEITHGLGVIKAVAATLTTDQRRSLLDVSGVRVFANGDVETSGAGCAISGGPVAFDGKRVTWQLLNAGGSDATVARVALDWPRENDKLKKLKLSGDTIFDKGRERGSTIHSGWKGKTDERTLSAGRAAELTVEFKKDAAAETARYSIAIDFAEGCSVSLHGGNGTVAVGPEGRSGAGPGGSSGLGLTVENTLPLGIPDRLDLPAPPPLSQCREGNGEKPYTLHPCAVGANLAHEQGFTGLGVTVAIVDTGLWLKGPLKKNTLGEHRVLAMYDALENQEVDVFSNDDSGHGSHVGSIIFSSEETGDSEFQWNSIAPDADVVVVKVFGEDGLGSYADVIRGIDYIVANRETYGIRVLNLSLSAEPRSHYWDDPLNQAVMAAWQAGIVVVASAGNTGPNPMTIGVPGNVPYIITVGAVSDSYTPGQSTDDFLTSFSAAGPTHEGFVKPDVVAPGGHVVGLMKKSEHRIAIDHIEFFFDKQYFKMSGTSQAAGVVTGTVALMLQRQPWLTPDEVKYRLMETARPAVTSDGDLAYSLFQQGAGMINAFLAVNGHSTGAANVGLDIDLDLAGVEHYGGRANRDEDGDYYIMGLDGFAWSDGYVWSDGFAWNDAFIWNDGFAWNDAFIWNDAYAWNDSFIWNDAFVWSDSLSETMSINVWVDQE